MTSIPIKKKEKTVKLGQEPIALDKKDSDLFSDDLSEGELRDSMVQPESQGADLDYFLLGNEHAD